MAELDKGKAVAAHLTIITSRPLSGRADRYNSGFFINQKRN